MQNHLTFAINGNISDQYCGKTIQNELIYLMAKIWNEVIISRALTVIYYSIIADFMQLYFTIRFIDVTNEDVEIKENFLRVFKVDKSTSSGLTETLMSILDKF